MTYSRTAVSGLVAVLALGSAPALADTIFEVQNARSNALAGGPLSDYDKELLDRWGCESGSRAAYCRKIQGGANTGAYRSKRKRRGQ